MPGAVPKAVQETVCRALLLIGLTVAGCRGGGQVPEEGAVLLRFELADGAPAPDELHLWVYDDGGALWNDVRFPSEGTLPPPQGRDLGTILIQPGAGSTTLRIHARGFTGGSRRLDGTLTVPSGVRSTSLTLELLADLPDDTDGDGVPDPIDDCEAVPNPPRPAAAPPPTAARTRRVDRLGAGRPLQLPPGAACGTDGECAAGFCVDGVCCANACVGPCRSAADQSGAAGVCQPYANGSDPENECSGPPATAPGPAAAAPPPGQQGQRQHLRLAASECKSELLHRRCLLQRGSAPNWPPQLRHRKLPRSSRLQEDGP